MTSTISDMGCSSSTAQPAADVPAAGGDDKKEVKFGGEPPMVSDKKGVVSGNDLNREFKKADLTALNPALEKELKSFFDAMDGASRPRGASACYALSPFLQPHRRHCRCPLKKRAVPAARSRRRQERRGDHGRGDQVLGQELRQGQREGHVQRGRRGRQRDNLVGCESRN